MPIVESCNTCNLCLFGAGYGESRMDRACNTCNTCNTVFIDNSFYILYRADIQGQIADVYMSTYLLPIFGVTGLQRLHPLSMRVSALPVRFLHVLQMLQNTIESAGVDAVNTVTI